MNRDSTDNQENLHARKSRRGPVQKGTQQELAPPDVDPATNGSEDDDDTRLPDIPEESGAIGEGLLATGHAAIDRAVRLAPTSPGVYRMLNANNDVLYVGKAKNVRKRLSSYARVGGPHGYGTPAFSGRLYREF